MSKKDKTLKRIKTPSRRKFIKAAAATAAASNKGYLLEELI